MLPRVWWVDLETPEQREAALAWDGSYVVRLLSPRTLFSTLLQCSAPQCGLPHLRHLSRDRS